MTASLELMKKYNLLPEKELNSKKQLVLSALEVANKVFPDVPGGVHAFCSHKEGSGWSNSVQNGIWDVQVSKRFTI